MKHRTVLHYLTQLAFEKCQLTSISFGAFGGVIWVRKNLIILKSLTEDNL